MNRRRVLALVGVAGSGGVAGCLDVFGEDDAETSDEEADAEVDMAGGYDFSSCEYDLDDETVSYAPLGETFYNEPRESDTISVQVGYHDDIEDDEQQELAAIFDDTGTHHESAQSYSTGRDGIDKCAVAKLSTRDYVEYILPLPVDEE